MDEDKHRHTVWLTDEAWASVQKYYKDGNCTRQNEHIAKPFLRSSKKTECFYHLHQCIQRKGCQHLCLKWHAITKRKPSIGKPICTTVYKEKGSVKCVCSM